MLKVSNLSMTCLQENTNANLSLFVLNETLSSIPKTKMPTRFPKVQQKHLPDK